MHKRKQSTPAVEPLLLTIPEVAVKLNVGRSKVYTLIKRYGLPTVTLGGTKRVPLVRLEQWIAQQEDIA